MDLNLSDRARKKLEHLAPNEWKALEELVNRLYRQYGEDLLRVVLFGSKAREDFHEESDLDLLIVVRVPDEDYWEHWRTINDLTWDIDLTYGVVTTLILKTETQYFTMLKHGLLFTRNILHDGIDLWMTRPSTPSFNSI